MRSPPKGPIAPKCCPLWLRLPFLVFLACLAITSAATVAEPPAPASSAHIATRTFEPPPKIDYHDPPREYAQRTVDGWTFFIERELAEEYPDLAVQAGSRLKNKLAEMLRVLPVASHDRLHAVPIFLLLGKESKMGGRDNGAEYFQPSAPEHNALLDPRWGGALVIYSARNYAWLTDDWALRLLFHEFGHAWHLGQWPESQPDIVAAWHNAVNARLYDGVKDVQGKRLEHAYAVTNQLEYFAELTCAYFLSGEYEPFNREELRRRDPQGFAMIEKMWGVREAPLPARR
jgi:hypothetical protein